MKKNLKMIAGIIIVLLLYYFLSSSGLFSNSKEADIDPPTAGETQSAPEQSDESSDILASLPQNVQDSFADYEANSWEFKTDKTKGTKDGSHFQNREGNLREKDEDGNEISYREYDVNNKKEGHGRDAQRFITGDDGSVYYTGDHYDTFTRIR